MRYCHFGVSPVNYSDSDSEIKVQHPLGIYQSNFEYKYYTIIDFNDVDIRICLPEKRDIHRGRKAEVNITVEVRYILMSTEIEVNNCFVI